MPCLWGCPGGVAPGSGSDAQPRNAVSRRSMGGNVPRRTTRCPRAFTQEVVAQPGPAAYTRGVPLPLRLLPFSLLLACDPSEAVESGTGGNADSGPVGDPATVSLAGECAMDVDFGGFTVTDNGETTDVAGKVADGVVPIAVLEPIATEGDCQVLRQNNPHCEPTCDPGQTCDLTACVCPTRSTRISGRSPSPAWWTR